jgi:hypothetical protein
MFIKKVIPGSTSRLNIVDHNETYGRHILQKIVINKQFCKFVDLGCGGGAQFYPFPSSIARILSKFFPSSSFSIFFLMKKTKEYKSQFIQYPKKASLETNFFIGHNKNDS